MIAWHRRFNHVKYYLKDNVYNIQVYFMERREYVFLPVNIIVHNAI